MDFRVLGPLEVASDGTTLRLGGPKLRAILAIFLARPRQVVSVDQLIDALWEGEPPESAANALRVHVTNLRNLLEPNRPRSASVRLTATPPGYRLAVEAEELDALCFERLVDSGKEAASLRTPMEAAAAFDQALSLWRGPAFADVRDLTCLQGEIARLEELRESAVEELFEARLAMGEHAALVGALETAVADHPLREHLTGQLMLALYRSGRQADALRAFQQTRRTLAEELGIDPGTALRRLEQAIIEQDPALDLPRDRVPSGSEWTSRAPLPRGTVTLLLADIEGFAILWKRQRAEMAKSLGQYEERFAAAVDHAGGRVVQLTDDGDKSTAVFALARDAVAAAIELARGLADPARPELMTVRMRIALGTGEVEPQDGAYPGDTQDRSARLRTLARGGQILLSEATATLVADNLPEGTSLVDLGSHSLRARARPERVYELRLSGVQERPTEPEAQTADVGVLSSLAWTASASPFPFVGRGDELQTIRDEAMKAAKGERRLALLCGEPGIGKTRLAAEAVRLVHEQGAVVLYGHCDEDPREPYGPIAEAIRHYARACSPSFLRDQLGEQTADLTRLVPEVGERVGGVAIPLGGDPASERHRLFEAADRLLIAAAAEQLVVLVLDDLQWADKPTLLLLRHLMRSFEPASLFVLGIYRDSDLGRHHPFTEVLADLRRSPGYQQIQLVGLNRTEVVDLLEAATGQSLDERALVFADRLSNETDGNPFYVQEIVRHLIETEVLVQKDQRWDTTVAVERMGIPESVRQVIMRRISRLSEEANGALAVASVIGAQFEPTLVGTLSGMGEGALLSVLDEVLSANLVIEVPDARDCYTFAHALVRQTLYEGLSTSRLVRLHRQVGVAMEELYAGDLDAHLDELSHHFCEGARAGDIDKPVKYARQAGDRALSQVAYEAAVSHYQRALDVFERIGPDDRAARCELLLALGSAYNKAGDLPQGKEAVVGAAALARSLDRPDRLAQAALNFGGIVPVAADVDDARAVELLEGALRSLPEGDSAERALVLARLAQWLHRIVPFERRDAMTAEAVEMARRVGDRATLAAALTYRYWAIYGPKNVEDRLAAAEEISRLGLEIDDKELTLQGTQSRVHALMELGDIEAAEDAAVARNSLANDLREPHYLWSATVHEGLMAGIRGQFTQAEQLAAKAREFKRQSDPPQANRVFDGQMFQLRWLQGRLDEMKPRFAMLVDRDPDRRGWRSFLAWACAENGEIAEAKEHFERLAVNDFDDIEHNFDWWSTVAGLAITCWRVDDPARAAQLHSLLLPYRSRNATAGQSAFFGAVAYHLGLLAGTFAAWDSAIDHLDLALERHSAVGARPFVALTQAAYAHVLLERGRSEDASQARSLLEQALATARELGMKGLR